MAKPHNPRVATCPTLQRKTYKPKTFKDSFDDGGCFRLEFKESFISYQI